MEQYLNTAYDVTTQLFGPESGIPWWAWGFVVLALFWKVAIGNPKSVREVAEDRQNAMLDELTGGGKKGKKK
jgi:hypothetical protein